MGTVMVGDSTVRKHLAGVIPDADRPAEYPSGSSASRVEAKQVSPAITEPALSQIIRLLAQAQDITQRKRIRVAVERAIQIALNTAFDEAARQRITERQRKRRGR